MLLKSSFSKSLLLIAATALFPWVAQAQEHAPFGNRDDGPNHGSRIEQPAPAWEQDPAETEPEPSPLRKEWMDLLAARETALHKILEPQNAADARKLEELKNRAAQSDIELAKHILAQIEIVRRGEPIEAEEPEAPAKGDFSSAGSNSPAAQLWRIKKARDEALKRAILRINSQARGSCISLQQRAIKANDLDLAGEIKAAMDAANPVANTQEPWLGTFKKDSEVLVVSRKGKELALKLNGKDERVEWDTKLGIIRIAPGAWFEWHVKPSADGSKLTQTKGRNVGKAWKRVNSYGEGSAGIGTSKPALRSTAGEVWTKDFRGLWKVGWNDKVEITQSDGKTYIQGKEGGWKNMLPQKSELKIYSASRRQLFIRHSDGPRLLEQNGKNSLVEIDEENQNTRWFWTRENRR